MTPIRPKSQSTEYRWRARLSAFLGGMPESARQRRWRLISRLAQVSVQVNPLAADTPNYGARAAQTLQRIGRGAKSCPGSDSSRL